jgi:hypothetical protein
MEYQEHDETWLEIKRMPLAQFEWNQWKLFNPTLPLPGGLRWNRVLNWLTRGKTASNMLKGGFSGGRMYAQQWFRFAARSVAICLTADGLFQRAINGTINAGGVALHHREFLGFDGQGQEVRYDYSYGFIYLEVILRRWPPSTKSAVLQGIILSKVMDAGISPQAPELVQLASDLLARDTVDIPEGLRRAAGECRARLK